MKLWSRIVELVELREPATVLALFRICLGLMVLYTVGSVVWHDIVPLVWLDEAYGGYRKLEHGNFLVQWLGGPSPSLVWGLVAAVLVTGVALTLGLGGRLIAFATLWLVMAVTDLNGQAGGSYDELLTSGIWLLVLGPSTATWSLDCYIRTGSWHDPTATSGSWVRWLGTFQVILAYCSTGFQKVSAYWTPAGGYSALYYILQQPSWHRWDMSAAAYVYPLTQLMSFCTWSWEVGAPLVWLWLWLRHTRDRGGRLRRWMLRWDLRAAFALFGLMLHVGVWATMEVGPFSPVTLSFYLCFFHPDELAAAWARLRRRGAPAG